MIKNVIALVLLIIMSTYYSDESIEKRNISEQETVTVGSEFSIELLNFSKVEHLDTWYLDDAYQVNIGEIYLDCLLPITELKQIEEASNNVYAAMIQAGVNSFVRGIYNYVSIEYSVTDGMILYNYSVHPNSLGGCFSILVDGTTGRILGCYPGE